MVDAVATGEISLPPNFVFGEVSFPEEVTNLVALKLTLPPSLGPLAAFTGAWTGSGFNTIFRPNSVKTPTVTPIPFHATPGSPVNDNILELNITSESLTFSPSLGSVPNRGTGNADAFLNGVPYLQAINDVTIAGKSPGIHVEPGIWVIVPPTTDPAEGATLARMASIPHGSTINAQGTSSAKAGAPTIPAVSITPIIKATNTPFKFDSQTAATPGTPRIPQDLTSFIAAKTITQEMLDDPNSVLRNHIKNQTITETTTISIATDSKTVPAFGGGTDNIAFLLGDAAAAKPNANATVLSATFWIETVEHSIVVPVFKPGQSRPLTVKPQIQPGHPGQLAPSFEVNPPIEIKNPVTIKVKSTQIQYSQTVILDFNGLLWPHVSVATLVPATALPIPPSVWAQVSP